MYNHQGVTMKHITIKDIARSLCISVSTVSRALTDDKNIRKETRDMVVEEAKRLGYKRNPVAMNLKMGRTNTVGVIVPEMPRHTLPPSSMASRKCSTSRTKK